MFENMQGAINELFTWSSALGLLIGVVGGMIIGALLQAKHTSNSMKACCRLGADYHVDAPKEGVRYLFKFGQEALNNN